LIFISIFLLSINLAFANHLGQSHRCTSSSDCTQFEYCGYNRDVANYQACLQKIANYRPCNPTILDQCLVGPYIGENGRPLTSVCTNVSQGTIFPSIGNTPVSAGYYCLPRIRSYSVTNQPSSIASQVIKCYNSDQCERGGICSPYWSSIVQNPTICLLSNIRDNEYGCYYNFQCSSEICNGASTTQPVRLGTCGSRTKPTVDITAASTTSFPEQRLITVTSQQPVTISWTVTSASSCTSRSTPQNIWSGPRSHTSGGMTNFNNLRETTLFQINCTNQFGSTVRVVQVRVIDPPVLDSFMAQPSALSPGQSSMLTWNVPASPGLNCVGTNGMFSTNNLNWAGTKPVAGSFAVTPTSTTTFTLACSNPVGSTSKNVVLQINLPNAPTLNFVSSSLSINRGQSADLRWTSTNANSCTASVLSGDTNIVWAGNRLLNSNLFPVTPTVTTTLRLTCTGSGGSISRDLTINVNQPPDLSSFIADRTTINRGQRVLFTWNNIQATSCTGSGPVGVNAISNGGATWNQPQGLSNRAYFSPQGTSTFTLTCRNSAGTSTKSIIINVNNPTFTSISLTANPIIIPPGGSSNLVWNTNGFTSCRGSGAGDMGTTNTAWDAARPTSGNFVVYPSRTTNYRLTCTTSAGTTSFREVTLTMMARPSINYFTFTRTNPFWQSTRAGNLAWSTENMRSCRLSGGNFGSGGIEVGLGQNGEVTNTYVSGPATTEYTLTCISDYEPSTTTRFVTLGAPAV